MNKTVIVWKLPTINSKLYSFKLIKLKRELVQTNPVINEQSRDCLKTSNNTHWMATKQENLRVSNDEKNFELK